MGDKRIQDIDKQIKIAKINKRDTQNRNTNEPNRVKSQTE